jgi:prolyl-tRNA synthetase
VPVIKGLKSNQEKFAGADASYSIEAMMRNVWALQAGTSHNLGQNFARAFDITYLSEANEQEFCWTTSWGVSTRFIGAVIMAHGDDQGLRLPPRLAPIQTVIVPIYKNDDERSVVMPVADRLFAELKAGGVRVHMDDREQSPGFKFNDWEMRGVPIRMEVGPKDVEKESAALARRDVPGKAGKGFYPQSNILETVKQLLSEIHEGLLQQATDFRDSNLHQAASLEELTEIVESGGWALTAYDGSKEAEDLIKDATKATSRCFPLKGGDVEPGTKCAITGREAVGKSYYARAF